MPSRILPTSRQLLPHLPVVAAAVAARLRAAHPAVVVARVAEQSHRFPAHLRQLAAVLLPAHHRAAAKPPQPVALPQRVALQRVVAHRPL